MTEREHRLAKKSWKAANRKRRKQQRATQIIMADTPESTPPPTPNPYQPRDRSALYRRNVKLEEELKKMKTKYYKYKKRFQGVKQSSVQK
nr:unnamed protein product [Callosobruchus analis]